MRLIGLVVLLCTALAAYIGWIDPLRNARNGVRFVTWYPESAAIVPVGSITGLFFLVLGARAEGALKFLGRSRAAGIAVVLALAVLAFAAFLAAQAYFRSLGYS